jgi:hypothetical protein
MSTSILAPAAVLILWSMLVMLWMAATRFPELAKLGDKMKDMPRGGRYQDIESLIPTKVNWKSHNYTHLMEQPTIFYPAVVILHLAGADGGSSLWLAWAYVILRIMHSLWQGLVNKLPVRIALFGLSSLCLIILAVQAVLATI